MNEAVLTLSQQLDSLTALLQGQSPQELTPTDLMQAVSVVEGAGRAIGALQVRLAGEVADRSRPGLGSDGLAHKLGAANCVDLLATATRAPRGAIAQRVRLARLTSSETSLTGATIHCLFPAVAAGLTSGRLGVDAAQAIVNALVTVRHASYVEIAVAEASMVADALGAAYDGAPAGLPHTFQETQISAQAWKIYLDPDGVRPSEEEAMKERCVSRGIKRGGLISYRLNLMPEAAGAFDALLDAYTSPRTHVGFPRAEDQAIELSEAGGSEDPDSLAHKSDPRSLGQKRHDALVGIVSEAARSDSVPHLGGDYPTVLVTIREEDLLGGRGAGWIDGTGLPMSAQSVHQMTCTGGIQKVMRRADGKLVALGTEQRTFNRQQRRAIAARDGGCIVPGCDIPARRTEVHHVHEASRGGPTDCANGVLLCWFHHRTIEASGWRIKLVDGVPWIKAPPWLDGFAGPNPWRRARGAPGVMADRLVGELDVALDKR